MIEKIKGEIGILGQVAARINELIDAVAALKSMRGENGVTVNVTETDVVISAEGGGGGSGLPSGYGPEEWTVYDGGVVTTRNFLTDNPD